MSDFPHLFRDPWAKREAWRKHPVFARRAMFASMFPGFGIGLGAFAVYLVFEKVYLIPKQEHAHGHGHGHDSHH